MKLIKEARRLQKLAGIIKEENIPAPEDAPVPAEETPIPPPEPEPAPTPEAPAGDITKEEAKNLIKATKGRFFTVSFIKRTDGTKRVMNARLGVKAYLKGGELPYNPNSKGTHGLIPVFDIPKKAYRMINVDTITKLKIGNNEYQVQ
jgi:hypothetical protein